MDVHLGGGLRPRAIHRAFAGVHNRTNPPVRWIAVDRYNPVVELAVYTAETSYNALFSVYMYILVYYVRLLATKLGSTTIPR